MSKREKLRRKLSNRQRNKTIDYYLSLPYTLEIIPDKEQGGWFIKVKELRGCMAQADRWEDILPMIEEAKQLWLEATLKHGDPVPEPAILPTTG